MDSISLPDPLDLVSFLLMLYAGGIALFVTWKASRVSLSLLFLSSLLAMMILLHGVHHLFTFLENPLQWIFEFGAAVFALALSIAYAYMWKG